MVVVGGGRINFNFICGFDVNTSKNFTNICGKKQNVSNQEDYFLDRRKKGKVFGGENQGTGGKAVKQRVCGREGASTDADGRGKGGRGRTRVCPLSSPLLCPSPALTIFPTSAGTPM